MLFRAMKRKLKCYLWLFATPKLIANKVISYSFQRRILLDQYYQKMIPVIEEVNLISLISFKTNASNLTVNR